MNMKHEIPFSFYPLIEFLDSSLKKETATLAIEGGSASGKTTLSRLLEQRYDCAVFHMDDFFLQPHQRTALRFAEPGGNVDRERFLAEVLLPLSKQQPVEYRRFDCSTLQLQTPMTVKPAKLNIIEGAYSMHPELREYYDFSVFLDISPEFQKQRILKRNTPPQAEQFFQKWIPMEQIYFDAFNIKNSCSLILTVS